MTTPSAPIRPQVPPRNRLRTGALTFAGLTLAGLVSLFAIGARDGSPLDPVDLHLGFLLLAAASAFADMVVGGLRLHLFIRRLDPRSPLWFPIRADLVGRFIGAVTPSQTGGGPAQVFMLHRGGVSVPAALSLLLVNLISTLVVLLLAGSLAAGIFADRIGGGPLHLMQGGLLLVLAMLGMAVCALLRPDLVSRPLARVIRRSAAGPGPGRRPTVFARVAGLLVDSLEQYRVACRRFVRECPWLPVASFGLTFLMYLNKFGMAWLVMRGLGIESDFLTTVALMALIHVGTLLAPSPGGSGIAEVTTGATLSMLLPGAAIGLFTLIYRLFAVYLPAAVGAWLLLAELRPRPRRGSARAQRAMVAGLVLALGVSATAVAGADTGDDSRCPLCCEAAPAPTPLLRSEIEATAESLAARNRREIDRIDSLLGNGRLGPPGSREARARAQLQARATLANWYAFMLRYAEDPEKVRVVAPEAIAPMVARYCEAVAVPMPYLRELRLGRGRVCARYQLPGSEEEGWTVLGGRRLRYRVGDRVLGERVRRVLGLDWPSVDMGKLEVLVEEHYGFRLARARAGLDDGDPCELLLALEVSGGWVRRHGVHRPAGFAFWSTRPTDDAPYGPRTPRVGSVIYVPGLRFRLPLLPDIELDDVRRLHLPMPFLDAEDLRHDLLPSWLPRAGELNLAGWTSEGSLPPALRTYFPEHRGNVAVAAQHEPDRMRCPR